MYQFRLDILGNEALCPVYVAGACLALEVLASVDFIRQQNPGISLADTITAIHNWSERKTKLFKNEYIQIAYDHLDTFSKDSMTLF